MNERIIELTDITPKEFWGAQDIHLEAIKKYYPKLKIVARGTLLKAYGEEEILNEFETRFRRLMQHFSRYNRIDDNVILRVLESDAQEVQHMNNSDKILVHGIGGKLIKAMTPNQQKLVDLVMKNDMVFAIGPAGTGKTYTGVAMAVKALKEEGANVKGMVAIFNYGFSIADENFKNADVKLTTLSDYDHLLEQTFDSSYISESELETLKKWRENPSEWNQ